LGIFPLLIWIPTVLFNLKWLKLFFILILKKLPLFYLLKTLFSKTSYTWIFVIRIIIGIFGLFCSAKNFKLFFCWSSVVKSGFIRIIFLKNPFWGWVFYFIYSVLGLFICFLKYSKKADKIFLSNPNPKIFLLKIFLLVLAGFPPFFGFLKKFFFFKSFKILIFFKEILEFEFFLKNFFFTTFMRFLLIFKVCAYIKFFVKKIIFYFKNLRKPNKIKVIILVTFILIIILLV